MSANYGWGAEPPLTMEFQRFTHREAVMCQVATCLTHAPIAAWLSQASPWPVSLHESNWPTSASLRFMCEHQHWQCVHVCPAAFALYSNLLIHIIDKDKVIYMLPVSTVRCPPLPCTMVLIWVSESRATPLLLQAGALDACAAAAGWLAGCWCRALLDRQKGIVSLNLLDEY